MLAMSVSWLLLISIHALREEGDGAQSAILRARSRFLSTPSARRATISSTHAPSSLRISIHALREEGDPPASRFRSEAPIFLSTPSARRATCKLLNPADSYVISIHALREEGDMTSWTFTAWKIYFYPRPPRGGRRLPTIGWNGFQIFLSTPSARRATERRALLNARRAISIHALREEGDIAQ